VNNQAKETKNRVSQGVFRHYVFGASELLAEAQRLMEQVGYELKPASHIGFVQPDFRAKRKTATGTYEIVGLVRESLDQAVEALIHLAAIRAVNRDVDCILVLPPANEYLLIELLTEEKGRWYFAMKDSRLTVWFCNPEEHTTMCVIGAASDKEFQKYFYLSKMSFDAYMSTRAAHLIQERLLAEEEDEE
jgi:hypothetical protein